MILALPLYFSMQVILSNWVIKVKENPFYTVLLLNFSFPCSCLKHRWDVDLVELAGQSIVNGQSLHALAGARLYALAGGLHALAGGLHACLLHALLAGDLLQAGGRSRSEGRRRSSHSWKVGKWLGKNHGLINYTEEIVFMCSKGWGVGARHRNWQVCYN